MLRPFSSEEPNSAVTRSSGEKSAGGPKFLDLCATLKEETLSKRAAHVNVLLRLSTMAGLQMDMKATVNLLCEQAAQIINFDAALAYLWDPVEERPVLVTTLGSVKLDGSAIGNVLDFWSRRHAKPALVNRGRAAEAEKVMAELDAHSALTVPIFAHNRAMGSLQFFSKAENAFTEEDGHLLWVMVRIAENLLSREQDNRGLMQLAFTDHLTGLRTRGYFDQQLDNEIKRSARKNEQFVLLMLDIDHFKTFNDTYGHPVGDQVLRRISRVLIQDMREVDTVARYGGEEFAIILPETDAKEGLAAAQRLRKAVEEVVLKVPADGNSQKLSISIGMAVFGVDSRRKRELLEFADAALYMAKRQGRNRVVAYSELPTLERGAS
jgi:diguanylate cyclase (GGDEF)-like protein